MKPLRCACLVAEEGDRLLLVRVRQNEHWYLPGGKIEEGEQPRDALRRELEEELGIDATIGEEVLRMRHDYKNGGSVELRFFVVDHYNGEVVNKIFKDIRWAHRRDLAGFDFLEADMRLLEGLSAGKIVSTKVLT